MLLLIMVTHSIQEGVKRDKQWGTVATCRGPFTIEKMGKSGKQRRKKFVEMNA